ncbi:GPW/gp25 family protein [Streptacidiphilus anmyonensis]|uniref:GPW/gp25 family protein n=1 Tax=Streptacidiphilus anmyonensis TaxID=405782 RepID=UPI0005AA6C6C|nr:GPW/gp25 family protein [Streptacidiphilus anmyonensis]
MHEEFIGCGWAYPLGVDATGRVAMVGGARELEQAVELVLMTYPGERAMRPEFGCPLRDYVFAGADSSVAGDIALQVRRALERWEPRIDVAAVDVGVDPDHDNRLLIDIQYAVKDTNDWRNLVFPFYTIPQEG